MKTLLLRIIVQEGSKEIGWNLGRTVRRRRISFKMRKEETSLCSRSDPAPRKFLTWNRRGGLLLIESGEGIALPVGAEEKIHRPGAGLSEWTCWDAGGAGGGN